MSVFRGDALLFDLNCRQKAAASPLVRLYSEEEAPLPRLGPRLSAPRPVAMCRLLDRLVGRRKRFTRATPHAIHDVLRVTRLTSRLIRFRSTHHARCRSTSSGRCRARCDKRESYVVRPIGNQMISARASKKIGKNFRRDRQKRKRRSMSGVHKL